jgi:hypothetical protein
MHLGQKEVEVCGGHWLRNAVLEQASSTGEILVELAFEGLLPSRAHLTENMDSTSGSDLVRCHFEVALERIVLVDYCLATIFFYPNWQVGGPAQ